MTDTDDLVRLWREGDDRALEALFSRHRERLKRMIRLRLDPRLRSRLDDSDVVQEVYLAAHRRMPEYLRDPKIPFFLWLRLLTGQQLIDLHRSHLGVQARDIRREIPIPFGAMPEATSAALAAQLIGKLTTPSQKVARAEMLMRVQEALESLEPMDREILVLRHFEQLSNAEAAEELGIQTAAASQRYVRALMRLRKALAKLPGGLGAL